MEDIQRTVIWKREETHGNVKSVVEVTATVSSGVRRVSVSAYAIGKRGGLHVGYPGFTLAEWQEINTRVEKFFAGKLTVERAVLGWTDR